MFGGWDLEWLSKNIFRPLIGLLHPVYVIQKKTGGWGWTTTWCWSPRPPASRCSACWDTRWWSTPESCATWAALWWRTGHSCRFPDRRNVLDFLRPSRPDLDQTSLMHGYDSETFVLLLFILLLIWIPSLSLNLTCEHFLFSSDSLTSFLKKLPENGARFKLLHQLHQPHQTMFYKIF